MLLDIFLIKTPNDVAQLPVNFDFDTIVRSMQPAFERSDVIIHSLINTVYLIYFMQ